MIELCNSKKTYLGKNANGRKRWALDCSIGAVQFREDGGKWQDIDPSIEAEDTDDFSLKFTQVPYLGRIGNDSHRRIYPDRTNLDCWIEFQKPFSNMPAPSRSDRWFYWDFPNALMGIRFDNASIKFGFRLKNSNAPTSITIPFTTQGITRQGRLLYHNGEVIAELRKPVATDANEVERECEVSFGTGEVTVSLDTTGLAFPIDIDPTLDLQVTADLNDAHETEDDGDTIDYAWSVRMESGTLASGRLWGAHRWVLGETKPSQGDTIDVAYVELYIYSATYDNANGNFHLEKATSPAIFTIGAATFDITSRSRTTASESWVEDGVALDWHQINMVTELREVIDSHSPTAIACIFRPNQDATKVLRSRSHNSDPTEAAKLHIEWTEPRVPRHGFVNFQIPGVV